MAEINLAPGSEYAGLISKHRRRTYGLAIVIALLLAAVWGGLFVWQQQLIQNKRALERRLAAVEAEITRLGDQGERVTLFENRLIAVDHLLNQHVAWDPLLQDLERLLPPPVILNHLKIALSEGTLELAGETLDSDVIAQTLASVVSESTRPTIFTSAVLQSVSRLQQAGPAGEITSVTYKFTADVAFDPSKLRYGR